MLSIPQLMVINAKLSLEEANECKHIHSHQLNGNILVMKVESDDLYFLRYTGSDEVTLNGIPINNNRVYLFANGSTIKSPKGQPIFYSDVIAKYLIGDDSANISFTATEIEFKFPNGNIGLRGINISEPHGKLIAIMGASGAGKTTMLNVLAGLMPPSAGTIELNGIDIYKDKDKVKGVFGYVPQDDILIEELSVYDNLYFNAKLCFKNLPHAELDSRVTKTLEMLGLDGAKDLKVGNPLNKTISGGQRKRLNIALEIIREPSVMFVDEPTSGLSSKDSENVMDLLRELALKGKLIFVVIHQPSSDIFKMFDKVMVLDTGGYQIYYGNPVESVVYFKTSDHQVNADQGECPVCGSVNPELLFNVIESKVVDEFGQYTPNRKVSPTKWSEQFKAKFKIASVETVSEKPPKALDIPSRLKQFAIYLKRDLKTKISNTQYVFINLLEAPVLAFFLSFIIRYIDNPFGDNYIFRNNDNIPAYIIMVIVVALFIGLTVSAEEIFRDRKILKREKFLNLSRFSYLVSKLVILFGLSAIQSFLIVIVGNSILGIHGLYIDYWLVMFSISCFANLLGLNISSSFNSAVTIYILIPLLIIPQMVLAGAIFSFEKLNKHIGGGIEVPVIAEVMASRWAYEALMVNQFVNNDYERPFYEINKRESALDYKQAYFIPEVLRLLEEVEILENESDETEQVKRNAYIRVVRNETAKELRTFYPEGFDLQVLRKTEWGQEEVEALKVYYAELESNYSALFNDLQGKKEMYLSTFQDSPEKLEAFRRRKDDNYNENLGSLVKNKLTARPIIAHEGVFVQMIDPVYKSPVKTNPVGIKAHFYAAQKPFFNSMLPTLTVNLMVIWLMCLMLFVTLYFDFFAKLIDLASRIGSKGKS